MRSINALDLSRNFGLELFYNFRYPLFVLSLALFLNNSLFAAKTQSGIKLPTWERPIGNYKGIENPERKKLKSIFLSNNNARSKLVFDQHYGKKVNHRLVDLKQKILEVHKKFYSNQDAVLLHFQNKMIIPIGIDKLRKIKNSFYLSLGITKGKSGISSFPDINRSTDRVADPRPYKFGNNKLVTGKSIEFAILPHAKRSISFFQQTNTLVGLEFVDAKGYFGQFKVKGATEKLFLGKCQFCHSLEQVGASYGIDFLWPTPLYKNKKDIRIFAQVHANWIDAVERGIRMPAQNDIEKEDIEGFVNWLKVMKKSKGPFKYRY